MRYSSKKIKISDNIIMPSIHSSIKNITITYIHIYRTSEWWNKYITFSYYY